MGTTPNLGLPYPENSDLVTNGAQAMQDLAEAVENRLPKMAAGVDLMPGPETSHTITFPAGLFDTPPNVLITNSANPPSGTNTGNVPITGIVASVTTTSCEVFIYGVGGSWTTGAAGLFWLAVEGNS